MIKKYRKKPVIIEAIKWDGKEETYYEILNNMAIEDKNWLRTTKDNKLVIPTLEGEMKANVGDYIVFGVKNEVYPVKPEIFEETYEEVERCGERILKP